ncbi:MAG: hypothetical protein WDM84_08165 [Bauldia sp.]
MAQIAATYQMRRIASTKVRIGTVRPARMRAQARLCGSTARIAAAVI